MKRCPSCNRTIDDDSQSFCPADGSRLVSDASPPAADDYLQATIMATPSTRPSSELPPPDAFSTNTGQVNQPPPSTPNSPWPDNAYQANAPWPNQQTPPPPQTPAWQAPSAPLPPPPAKRGMNTKLLIGGGVGCLGLLLLGVIGIVLVFALSGPSSRMNPYTGSLRDLAPTYIGSFKQNDIDTLGDRDKEGFGRIKDAIGVAYKGSAESAVQVFIGNYASAEDAKDGLNTFRDKLSSRGWKAGSVIAKKIGWSTVGSTFGAYRSTSSNRSGEDGLSDGAVIVYAQSSSPSPSPSKASNREINCWTNGSVLYAVAGEASEMYVFERELDKAQK